ncbi:MAG: hypothetical protein PVI32_12330, partial [Desulfobacterales bacterium]
PLSLMKSTALENRLLYSCMGGVVMPAIGAPSCHISQKIIVLSCLTLQAAGTQVRHDRSIP